MTKKVYSRRILLLVCQVSKNIILILSKTPRWELRRLLRLRYQHFFLRLEVEMNTTAVDSDTTTTTTNFVLGLTFK